jgi:adenylate cyclase
MWAYRHSTLPLAIVCLSDSWPKNWPNWRRSRLLCCRDKHQCKLNIPFVHLTKNVLTCGVKKSLLQICFWLCCCPMLSWGQHSAADSLQQLLRTAKQDTDKVNWLVDLAWEINVEEPARAARLLNEAAALAKQIGYAKGEAAALSGLGTVADIEQRYDLALKYHQEALAMRQKLGDKRLMAASLNNIGNVLESKGKIYDAIDYYHKNLQILKEINDTLRLARAEVNIGGAYESVGIYITANEHIQEARYLFDALGDKESLAKVNNQLGHIWFENEKYDQALPHYELARRYYEFSGDTLGLASALANIANAYDEKGNAHGNLDTINLAFDMYKVALNLYAKMSDSTGIALVFNNMGILCKHLRKYEEGLGYLRQSLAIRQRMEMSAAMMENYNGFGDIYFGQKKYALALEYTEKYYQLAQQLGDEKFQQKAFKDFSKIYAKTGDFKKAYEYRVRYDEMRYRRLDENRVHEFARREQLFSNRKVEDELKRRQLELAMQDAELSRSRATRNGLIGGGVALLLLTALLYNRARLRAKSNKQLAAKNAAIERARRRADELLMNILPETAAAELKLNNSVKPVRYESVSVMFTDFKGFTKIAEEVSPEELIAELDACFRRFDAVMEKYGLEKIKTIGDSYMCAGGLPIESDDHAVRTVDAAFEMQRELKILMDAKAAEGKPVFEMRIGIHSGPVVAGVVGSHKFAYDIWGDTVNIAARMEQASEPNRINVSSATYEHIKHKYPCFQRGLVAAKNKGSIEMYFVDEANHC